MAADVRARVNVMSTDLFDEDDYVRPLLESLTPTLRRSLRSALATPETEAEFFVSHKLRYRREPEEWPGSSRS